ncbi:hypothetical protein H4R35_004064 [Dimargaris xerosporica]|nr:hypothetical protein H4R35_004064 [Dimargaris xerosporica]
MPLHSPWSSGHDTSSSHDSQSDPDEPAEPDPWTTTRAQSLARSWSLRQLQTPSTRHREPRAPGQSPWNNVEPVQHPQNQGHRSALPHSTTAAHRGRYRPLTPATGPHRLADIMEQVDSRVFRLRYLHRHHERLCHTSNPTPALQRPLQPQGFGQRDKPPPSVRTVNNAVTRYRPICLITVDPLWGDLHCELIAPALFRFFDFYYVLNESLAPDADPWVIRALFQIVAAPLPSLPAVNDYLNQHPPPSALISNQRNLQPEPRWRGNSENWWGSRLPRWRVPASWRQQYCFQAYFWVAWARFEAQQGSLDAARERLRQGKHLEAQPALDLIKEQVRLIKLCMSDADATRFVSSNPQHDHSGERPVAGTSDKSHTGKLPANRRSNCSAIIREDALSAAKQRYAESLRRREYFYPPTPSSGSMAVGTKAPSVNLSSYRASHAPVPVAKAQQRQANYSSNVSLDSSAPDTFNQVRPLATTRDTTLASGTVSYPVESLANLQSDSESLDSKASLADSMLELSSTGTSSAPSASLQCADVNALGQQLVESLQLNSPSKLSLKSQQAPSASDLGSIVAVTPIKPLQATKKFVGESPVLTPARRSMRVLQQKASPRSATSPACGDHDAKIATPSPTAHDKRIVKLLSDHGYAYIPNKAITIEPAPDSVLEAVKLELSEDDNSCGMVEENKESPATPTDSNPIKAESTTERPESCPKLPVKPSPKHRRAKQVATELPVRRSPRIQKLRERQNQQQ